jgi:hypothetical protein
MRKLGILFVVMALVIGFSATAMAQQKLFYTEKERLPTAPTKELEVYGSVRMNTFIQDLDKENASATGFRFDDDDLIWDLDDGSSRFGVRFKSGKVGANVEIRPRDRQTIRTRTVSLGGQSDLMRHWYGSYDLGFGTFILGQTWTPTFNPICNECLIGGGGVLDGYGDTGFTARAPGLQLHVPVPAIKGLFKFALLKPYVDVGSTGTGSQILTGDFADTDTTIPKIEASLSGAFGPLSFTVRGGYNTYDEANIVTDAEESVDAWVVAGDVTYSFGPFYIRGTGYWGQNIAVYGTGAPAVAFGLFPTALVAGSSAIEDVDNWGWFGVAGFKFNDMISIEAGYGQRIAELDVAGGTVKDDKAAFVVFLPISITPAFVITPEVLWTDEGELEVPGAATVDRGNRLYYGVYWRIDF